MIRSTETDPSVKVLAIGFILLIIGGIGYFLYHNPPQHDNESKEVAIPEYFDYGTVHDGVYCNDFFGFRLPVTEKYEANYQKYELVDTCSDVVKNSEGKDTIPIQPKLTNTITDIDLLLIEPELIEFQTQDLINGATDVSSWFDSFQEKSKRERFGPDHQLMISAHKLNNAPLYSFIDRFENLHHPNYGMPKTTMIASVPFQEYHGMESRGGSIQETTFRLLGGKNKYIISYFTEINGFALCIDLFYETEAQKKILLNIIDGLEFH